MGFEAAALRGGLEAWRKAAGTVPSPIGGPPPEIEART
jgi:hypothetical protein